MGVKAYSKDDVGVPLVLIVFQRIFKGCQRSSFDVPLASFDFQWTKGLAKDSKGRRLVSNGFQINFNRVPLIPNDFLWLAMDFLLFSMDFLSVSAKEFLCKGFKGFPLMSKDAL